MVRIVTKYPWIINEPFLHFIKIMPVSRINGVDDRVINEYEAMLE
jgi:hypothetical protein